MASLAANILRCAAWQRKLIVYAAMKNDAIAELLFEFFQFHPRTDMLNRIEHIHAAIEDSPQQAARSTVGLVKGSQAIGVNQIAPTLQPRL